MAAKAQHETGTQKGDPDHHVTSHFFGPDNGVTRGVAQHHIGKNDAGHGQQQHDEQPAVAGDKSAFDTIKHRRWGVNSVQGECRVEEQKRDEVIMPRKA